MSFSGRTKYRKNYPFKFEDPENSDKIGSKGFLVVSFESKTEIIQTDDRITAKLVSNFFSKRGIGCVLMEAILCKGDREEEFVIPEFAIGL